MVQLRSINFFLLVFISMQTFADSNPESKCRSVELKSASVGKKERTDLCFLSDETYFISRNCQDLNCAFMKRLKDKKAPTSSAERPGLILCKEIKGVVEGVQILETTLSIQRCLFPKEKSSISLNLLESWDGKSFLGPSAPHHL